MGRFIEQTKTRTRKAKLVLSAAFYFDHNATTPVAPEVLHGFIRSDGGSVWQRVQYPLFRPGGQTAPGNSASPGGRAYRLRRRGRSYSPAAARNRITWRFSVWLVTTGAVMS